MKLIVGLGNPGRRYAGTRHNVGFLVVDEMARRHGATFEAAPAEALMARIRDLGDGVLLAKPLTFMNVSGVAVRDLSRFYRIELPDLLVVTDDVNLPLGRLRARARGSDGGHNGLRSVVEQLGTDQFSRLRVGVGRGEVCRDLADHVLARFDPEERPVIEAAVSKAADAAGVFAVAGIDRVMNTFNRSETPAGEGEPAEG
ncbi:MAG: aminoacyl-tRNA hydrolase [Vicinamibacterales bacterium]